MIILALMIISSEDLLIETQIRKLEVASHEPGKISNTACNSNKQPAESVSNLVNVNKRL